MKRSTILPLLLFLSLLFSSASALSRAGCGAVFQDSPCAFETLEYTCLNDEVHQTVITHWTEENGRALETEVRTEAHQETVIPARMPTLTEPGLTPGLVCPLCGQEIFPRRPLRPLDWVSFAGDGWYIGPGGYQYYTDGQPVTDTWYNYCGHPLYFDETGCLVTSAWVGYYYLGEAGNILRNAWIGDEYVAENGIRTGRKAAALLLRFPDCEEIFPGQDIPVADGFLRFHSLGIVPQSSPGKTVLRTEAVLSFDSPSSLTELLEEPCLHILHGPEEDVIPMSLTTPQPGAPSVLSAGCSADEDTLYAVTFRVQSRKFVIFPAGMV